MVAAPRAQAAGDGLLAPACGYCRIALSQLRSKTVSLYEESGSEQIGSAAFGLIMPICHSVMQPSVRVIWMPEGTVRLTDDVRGFTAGGQNIGDMAMFYAFCLIQDQLVKEGLPGDIAELGVYKGHTAALLATTARRLEKTLYLFDTFEGFDQRDLVGPD